MQRTLHNVLTSSQEPHEHSELENGMIVCKKAPMNKILIYQIDFVDLQ